MSTSPASRRTGNVMVVALFLAVIGLPMAATIDGIDGGDQEAENRAHASFPRLDGIWHALTGYAAGLDRWFSDHFAFRATFVRWFGETRYYWLGVSPSASVVLGKDSWLFYADDFSLDDYTNDRPFSEFDLENWRAAVVRLRDWLQTRGVGYVITFAPDKYRVYPDEFPESVQPLDSVSRLDQVYNALSDTRVVVDVRPALSAARARERIYYLTDTHWNDRGAFAAYQQIIGALRAQNPAVPPAWAREDFDGGSREIEGRDLAGMMGLKHVLHEDDMPLVPRRPRLARVVEPSGRDPRAPADRVVTEIPGSPLPRAVVFRDSFAGALVPFLSEHFSRAVYLWQNDFDSHVVMDEHPDVVIQEIVGRHLYSFVPSPELVPQ